MSVKMITIGMVLAYVKTLSSADAEMIADACEAHVQSLCQELNSMEIEMLKSYQLVSAVRAYRMRCGCSIKKAKYVIDCWREANSMKFN